MINLLLVAPQTKQSKGGMAVWTDTFLAHCEDNRIMCDLLNIATIGSRAVHGNNKRNFMDEFARTRSIFQNLQRMLLSKVYDVAHINTSCGDFGLIRDYLIVRKIKQSQPQCKTLLHFHCDVERTAGAMYKKYALKKLLCITDEVVVLNASNRDFLKRVFSVESTILPNFIDEKWVRDTEKQISERIEKAIFVGYIQPAKGAREIYDLAKMFPQIVFNLIGAVRQDVGEWQQPKNVVFCGTKDRRAIIDALDEADVFVFPTHSEGFSISLLESMSRGLPCIATAVGANAEMIENEGGVIVSVGDVNAMARALKDVENPEKRHKMSNWNIQKVRSCYTVNAAMKMLAQLYKL